MKDESVMTIFISFLGLASFFVLQVKSCESLITDWELASLSHAYSQWQEGIMTQQEEKVCP